MVEDSEQRAFSRFRRLLKDFPEGEVSRGKPPAPDFIIVSAERRIGVELTQSFWDRQDKGSRSMRKLALWQEVLAVAEEEWVKRGHAPVSVDVTWNNLRYDPPTAKSEREDLAYRLVDAVEQLMPSGAVSRVVSHRESEGTVLPAQVRVVGIHPESRGWDSAWVSSIPRLEERHLQAEINRKESRLATYRKHCHEVWLVVWIDWSAPGTSYATPPRPSRSRRHLLTGFDRVFFLDTDSLLEFEVGESTGTG